MINFTPDLETKVPKIDRQHKELFKRINEVISLGANSFSKDETDKTLRMLGDYIIEHFSDEEKIQLESKYPKYNEHKAQHTQYIASFNELKQEYSRNGPSAAFTLQLNKSVIDWIVKHIRSSDKELGRYLNKAN